MAVKTLEMSVSDAGSNQKEFQFTATAEQLKEVSTGVVADINRYVSIPGFRKGKAPASIIVKRYEGDVKNEIVRKLMGVAFDQIAADKSLDILNCTLAKEPEELKLDSNFNFALKVQLAPEITLPDYKVLKVEAESPVATDAEVDERITYLKNMYGSYAEVEDAARHDDMLKVSYTSDLEVTDASPAGVKRAASSDDTYIWLNEPEYIPGAIAALTGAEVGKEYSFTASYPADWREESLANQQVNYTVKVHAIQRRTPISEEELCAKMEAENLDALKDMIRANILREGELKRKKELSDKIYNELDSKIPEFELPSDFLEAATDRELQAIAGREVKSEEDAAKFKEELEKRRAEAATAAKLKLRRQLILRNIAGKEEISVSNREIDTQIAIMSKYYGYKPADFRKMLEQNGALDDLRMEILTDKVMEKLAEYVEANQPKAESK